jgi:capsular polysaccharide biosynthesis protein
MAATVQEEDLALGRVIHLRALGAAIRRRWRVWVIVGLVGLVVGASLHLVIPRKYSATSDLYLAIPSGANPADVTANNVALLQTDAVAQQAIAAGHLNMSPHALHTHSSGLAVSDSIMSITFTSSSPSQAVAGARALDQAFLSVQEQELRRQTDGLVRSLRSQISSLNSSINTLDTQIANQSSASAANNTLTNLITERSGDQSQVSQLQGQIGQALTEEQSSNAVSHILDPATLVPVSAKKVLLVDGLSGLVAGLAIGFAVVLFGALFSEGAPDRGTVAETLGAPVGLSLERYRGPRLMRRRRLAHRLRAPDPAMRMIERRLRAQLESAPGSALAVVTIGASDLAALGVGALALDLSSEGRRVLVVDAADDRRLASMLGLSRTSDTMEMFPVPGDGHTSLRLLVAPPDPIQMAEKPPPDDTDALLILASLDPAYGAEHLAPWVSDAVMVLSTKGVTLARMDVGREMLSQAGISLRSVILLGSDPEDETSGVLSPRDLLLAPAPHAPWPK